MPVRADVACKALPRVCNPLRNGSFIALPLPSARSEGAGFAVESSCRDLPTPANTRQRDPSAAPTTHPAPHKLALLPSGGRCRAAFTPHCRLSAAPLIPAWPQAIGSDRLRAYACGGLPPHGLGLPHT